MISTSKVLFIILLSLLNFRAFTQSQTLAKNDALKFDADYYLMEKDFKKALNTYLTIIKSEPDNADVKYRIGICYLNSEEEKVKAIDYLEEAAQKISTKYNPSSFKEMNAPVDALFLLGSAYRVNNQLDEAIASYKKYMEYLDSRDDYNLKVVEQYIRNCEIGKSMINNPANIIKSNIGRPVNTETANFNAVVSGDGKTMFFTSPGKLGYEIFTTSMGDTSWSVPKNITSILGTGKYMMTSDLSEDGQTLLLVLDDPMNADIFVSKLVKNKWTKVEPLDKEINSKYNETHASLSPDGKTLYFTSDRKGGIGDKDIYKSEIDSKGLWGKPVNMGSVINTPFNEETPFITSEGRLFFSSEGHEGMGGYDIFYYDVNKPGSTAVNIGFPLNSTDNDLFFVPVGNGTSGFYSFRGNDTYGARDIYSIQIMEKIEELPQEVIALKEDTTLIEIDPLPEITQAENVESVIANVVPPEVIISPSIDEAISTPPQEENIPAPPQEIPVEETEQVINAPDFKESAIKADSDEEHVPPAGVEVSEVAFSYKIQIMALKKPVDFLYFQGLTGVTISYSSDNWYRYSVGNTEDRNVAEKLMNELISKGYKDAFVKGKSIYPKFTIQVMAVPGPVVDLTLFKNLDEVFVTKGADNFCRYSTGEFVTKEDALSNLDRIKMLGYKNAFVRKIQ